MLEQFKKKLKPRKHPDSFDADGLGTFTRNHLLNLFEADLFWLDSPVQLSFSADSDQEHCLAAARTLFDSQAGWDRRLREFAAAELLVQANEWAGIGGEEEEESAVPITGAQFMARMELELIEVKSDGGFDFWFDDGGLFFGHAIRISGFLEKGPDEVRLEG